MNKFDKNVINTLKRALNNNRLVNNFIFYGQNITKMYNTALEFIKLLYKDNTSIHENIMNNNFLNLTVIDLLADKSQITKDQITKLQEEFSYTSLIEGPKVFIINNFDKVNESAQNSLLKFIEDPQNKNEIYSIFITTNLERVLTTIKSRTTLISFKSDTKEEIINKLEYDLDDNYLLGTLKYNNYLYEYNSLAYNNLKKELISLISLTNIKDAIIFSKTYDINKDKLKIYLTILLSIYEDSINYNKNYKSIIYNKIDYLSNLNKNILTNIIKLILDTLNKIDYNMNISSLFHYFLRHYF